MNFYTDGSIIMRNEEFGPFLGWSAVWDGGVIIAKGRMGGTNVNAEMLAIRDLLWSLSHLNWKFLKEISDENPITINTDSMTSIQIINNFSKNPLDFDVNESENYALAKDAYDCIMLLKSKGKRTCINHVKGHERNIGNSFADAIAVYESHKAMEKYLGNL